MAISTRTCVRNIYARLKVDNESLIFTTAIKYALMDTNGLYYLLRQRIINNLKRK